MLHGASRLPGTQKSRTPSGPAHARVHDVLQSSEFRNKVVINRERRSECPTDPKLTAFSVHWVQIHPLSSEGPADVRTWILHPLGEKIKQTVPLRLTAGEFWDVLPGATTGWTWATSVTCRTLDRSEAEIYRLFDSRSALSFYKKKEKSKQHAEVTGFYSRSDCTYSCHDVRRVFLCFISVKFKCYPGGPDQTHLSQIIKVFRSLENHR